MCVEKSVGVIVRLKDDALGDARERLPFFESVAFVCQVCMQNSERTMKCHLSCLFYTVTQTEDE